MAVPTATPVYNAQAGIISCVTRRTRCEIASLEGGFAIPRLCRSWLKPSHAAISCSAASSGSSIATSFCLPSDLKKPVTFEHFCRPGRIESSGEIGMFFRAFSHHSGRFDEIRTSEKYPAAAAQPAGPSPPPLSDSFATRLQRSGSPLGNVEDRRPRRPGVIPGQYGPISEEEEAAMPEAPLPPGPQWQPGLRVTREFLT